MLQVVYLCRRIDNSTTLQFVSFFFQEPFTLHGQRKKGYNMHAILVLTLQIYLISWALRSKYYLLWAQQVKLTIMKKKLTRSRYSCA